ncbi:hypothetical protein NEHOM01_0553 [Nematocida homosporus]|uniref:uncharacterized protein n=1 Tax=Nematocida homosporus TaxID=1912981 RepID=UPI00221F547A|nr:uncharacterized protein NEHOM01_0553 [Nematocida homosporus]KAI5185002.1 hypothetical protein NEHOM01_0553 [Nematocida homosporus]
MKFTTANSNVNEGPEEALRGGYWRALMTESIEGLIEIAQQAELETTLISDQVHNLALSNAIRIALQREDYSTCAEILEMVDENELQEARLEYLEQTQQSLPAIFLINQILQNEPQLLLLRKRAQLRAGHGLVLEEPEEDVKVERLEDDLYVVFWELFQWIRAKKIGRVAAVSLVGRERSEPAWTATVVGWAKQEKLPMNYSEPKIRIVTDTRSELSPSAYHNSKQVNYDSSGGLDAGLDKVTLPTMECAVKVLDRFSSIWQGDLFYLAEEYSFYMAYLVILDYVAPNMLTSRIVEFVYRHLWLSKVLGGCNEYSHLEINDCLDRVVRKLSMWAWQSGRTTAEILHKVRVPPPNRPHSTEQMALDGLLRGYLVAEVSGGHIFELILRNPFFDIQPNSLYFRVLEKAMAEADANIALLCIAVIKNISIARCKEIFCQCSSVAQSFFLSGLLDNPLISVADKLFFFLGIAAPVREMFTYNNAVNLLAISPKDTHLSFFAHFIRPRHLMVPNTIYNFDKKKINLSESQFIRASELIKKYLKTPQRMYLSLLNCHNPLYTRILAVFLYKKEYEAALAIRPFDCRIIAEYIKHLHAQIVSSKYEKKSSLVLSYELCKKVANLFILGMYNSQQLESVELLGSVLNEGLSVLLSLELPLKKKDYKQFKEIPNPKPTFLLMRKALSALRAQCHIYPPYILESAYQAYARKTNQLVVYPNSGFSANLVSLSNPPTTKSEKKRRNSLLNYSSTNYTWFLRYDLWRILSFNGPLTDVCVNVIYYCMRQLSSLSLVEFDYLVQLRLQRLGDQFWQVILMDTDSKSVQTKILQQTSVEQIYAQYVEYLVNLEEDVSFFLFHILKTYQDLSKDQVEDIIDKMFFDSSGKIICGFTCWIPNLSVTRRREYFDYLFAHLTQHNPKLLKEIKGELRKQGFVIE